MNYFLLLVLTCIVLTGCQTNREPDSQLVKGNPINAEESGSVIVMSKGRGCSGTLLTNNWIITAAHCQLDIGSPANIGITMGSQSTFGAFAVNHPSLDFGLVRLQNPFKMQGTATGFQMPLFTAPTASLTGQIVRCRGYGCNAFTTGGDCTGFDGTLREALLPVKVAPVDDYSFSVGTNAQGQGFAPGDSGGGCFANTAQGWALAGVLKGPDLQRAENWRDWAMAYVNGTPIPLPDQWFIGSTHPTFLKRPLGNDYQDTHTWVPCPGGKQYSFTPTFDLENARDFVTISAGDQSVTLTGNGMTNCTGTGPITTTLNTNHDHPSTGLLSMPIDCNYAGPSSKQPLIDGTPAVTGVGNNIYFFVKTADGRIMYNRAELGQGGLCWSEVDGNGRTDAAPAAGAVGNHVFVAIKGLDGHVYINQADLGRPFGQWFRSDILTDTSPAVTGVGDNIYFFVKTPEGRIMYNRAQLGQPGVGWVEVDGNGRTNAAPAAGAIGSHVFVAVKGLDGILAVNQADLGHPFGQWFPSDQATDSAPAVTGVGDNVYFFVRTRDGRIRFNRAKLGEGGIGWVDVEGDGRTDSGPGAGAVGTHVFVAIRAPGGRFAVNQADLGHSFGQWF